MYCQNCNREIPDGTSFCPYCGIRQQSAPQNTPPAWNSDENATVLADSSFNGVEGTPAYNYAPPVSPDYNQQPVNQNYQAPVNQGYQQSAAPDFQQPVSPAYNQPDQQPKKSNTGLIIGIVAGVIGLLIVLVVILVIALGSSGSSYDDSYDNDSVISDDIFDDSYDDVFDDSYDADEVSAEFQKLLDDNALTFIPADFGDLDYMAYGIEDSDGMIDIQEFGYNGDHVEKWYETIYYPITGYTQDTIDALDENMREAFSQYETLDFCTVDYYEIADFYVIELYITDLNTVTNVEKLQEIGIVEDGFVLFISISQTEADLVSKGYVKR